MQHLRLAVVGLGTLGNEVVRTLGLMRPATVLCIDPDLVEASNVCRSIFYRLSDQGQKKSKVLTRAARDRFPETEWVEFSGAVADLGWTRLEDCHLIFGCVDRDSARLETARISTRLDIPVCDGGLAGSAEGLVLRGRVTYFSGRQGACFGCRLGPSRRRELLREWTSDAHPCSELEPEVSRPSTPAMAAITGALQVELGLRAVSEQQNSFSAEIHLDGSPRFETCRIAVSETCPFHERQPSLARIQGRFAEELQPEGTVIGWEWPICTRARCQACGEEWSPLVRRARVRNCPNCRSGNILRLECTNRVSSSSPWAARRPEEIGLPAGHLYTVWKEIME